MKNKRGVGLIVLIIAIIILIVLAGIIILQLKDKGIIQKTNEAVDVTDLAQVKNLAALEWSDAYLDGEITQDKLETAVLEGLTEQGVDTKKYKITVTEAGVDIKEKIKYKNQTDVPEKWETYVEAIVDTVPIPKGFVASQATGEDVKLKGLVIYEGEEPVTDANVDEARKTRNQYVWVPIDKGDFESDYIRRNFEKGYSLSNELGTDYWEVELKSTTNLPSEEQDSAYVTNKIAEGGITNTLAEVQAMYASVKEYEGFYIARYEAGIDKQRKGKSEITLSAYSMMGKIPYTFMVHSVAMDDDMGGAVQIARSIYPVNDTELNYGVVSTLTYGVQWDSVLQWWLDTKAVESVLNSTSYGNHLDHEIQSINDLNEDALVWNYTANTNGDYVPKESETLSYPKASGTAWVLSTGALKAAKVNNIYDMAGNVQEWTMEGYSTGSRIIRGGYFYRKSSKYQVAHRYTSGPNVARSYVGIRLSLYIKK